MADNFLPILKAEIDKKGAVHPLVGTNLVFNPQRRVL